MYIYLCNRFSRKLYLFLFFEFVEPNGWKPINDASQHFQVYRNLLKIEYNSGLEHLPDIISGTDTMQNAYFWSKQASLTQMFEFFVKQNNW